MSLMMMLAASSQRQIALTFTTDATWTPGPTVTRIDKIVGKGSDGTTTPETTEQWIKVTVTTIKSQRNQPGFVRTTKTLPAKPGSPPEGGDYCDVQVETPDDPVYESSRTCYSFETWTETVPSSQQPGIAATGFGKTFPGGPAGGPATPLTYTNIPVTPGQPYPMHIVGNGYITISYLE